MHRPAATLPLPASLATPGQSPAAAVAPIVVDRITAGQMLGGISESSINRLIRSGALKPVKILDRTMIAVRELESFVARLTAEQPAAVGTTPPA